MAKKDEENEFLEFLQDLPPVPELFSSKASAVWGRELSESLFKRMARDREFLQLLIWESIAPKIVDFAELPCLFSRYTCFKFFDRFGISVWRTSKLMGIPVKELTSFFPVAELRYIFGAKIVRNLFDQFNRREMRLDLQDFSDLCAQYSMDHAKQREKILNSDLQLPPHKQLLLHASAGGQHLGLYRKSAEKIDYDNNDDFSASYAGHAAEVKSDFIDDEKADSFADSKNDVIDRHDFPMDGGDSKNNATTGDLRLGDDDVSFEADGDNFGDADLARSLADCFADQGDDNGEGLGEGRRVTALRSSNVERFFNDDNLSANFAYNTWTPPHSSTTKKSTALAVTSARRRESAAEVLRKRTLRQSSDIGVGTSAKQMKISPPEKPPILQSISVCKPSKSVKRRLKSGKNRPKSTKNPSKPAQPSSKPVKHPPAASEVRPPPQVARTSVPRRSGRYKKANQLFIEPQAQASAPANENFGGPVGGLKPLRKRTSGKTPRASTGGVVRRVKGRTAPQQVWAPPSQLSSSEERDGDECTLEIPAFSSDDLRRFSAEEDLYVTYALTFACCEKTTERMRRVRDALSTELKNSGFNEENNMKSFIENEGVKPAGSSACKNNSVAADKLRQLMAFFAPKNSKFDANSIRSMKVDELLAINLNEFARCCEMEFSKIIEDSKRHVGEKCDIQLRRYVTLLAKMVEAYQPANQVFDMCQNSDLVSVNLLSLERSILQHLEKGQNSREPYKFEPVRDPFVHFQTASDHDHDNYAAKSSTKAPGHDHVTALIQIDDSTDTPSVDDVILAGNEIMLIQGGTVEKVPERSEILIDENLKEDWPKNVENFETLNDNCVNETASDVEIFVVSKDAVVF